MNMWLPVLLITLGLAIGTGFVAKVLLIKWIGPVAKKIAGTKWQEEDVTRFFARVALLGPGFLLIALLPWSFLMTTFGSMADQYFRNSVNQWMSGPDLFQHLAIDEEEYFSLPLHWRQALAEIALREGDEDESLRQFISKLGTSEIQLLEAVARHAMSGSLVYGRGAADGEPIPGASYMDLQHLEAIGIIDSALPLNHQRIELVTDGAAGQDVHDELWLFGHEYGLQFRAVTAGESTMVSFIALTEDGKWLVRALREPTSLPYLCELHDGFRGPHLSTAVWSVTSQDMDEGDFRRVSDITEACEQINATVP